MKLFSQKAAFCHIISASFSLPLSFCSSFLPFLSFLSIHKCIILSFSFFSHRVFIHFPFHVFPYKSEAKFSPFLNFNKQTNFLSLHFETFQRVVSEKERKETKEKEENVKEVEEVNIESELMERGSNVRVSSVNFNDNVNKLQFVFHFHLRTCLSVFECLCECVWVCVSVYVSVFSSVSKRA